MMAVMTGLALTVIVVAACGGSGRGGESTEVPPTEATTSAPPATGGAADVEAAKELFRNKGCVACHVVNGVEGAVGTVGPVLDGLASREELAAGLPVTRENVAKWISDPAGMKPGTVMPDPGLSDLQVDALTDWLMTLK
jgi:cytochrome c oxidase subunit 2